jgi:EmrB/QacA subfamily drug resistance transporter
LAVLCLSLLIVSIDTTILNVALPSLVRDLGATPSQLQWIVDAYTLAFAGLLLTAGALGDRLGRRGVMTAGLVVFGVASVGAAFSGSSTQLIAWRALLGVGAALIMPATLSILVNVFTEERQRRRAIAYWSLMNATGSFIGPVAGGLLLRAFPWGACFLVNVPVVVLAMALQRRFVPTSRDPAQARFDVPGAVLSTLGLGALLWAVIEGPGYGWGSPAILGGLAASALLFATFVARERRTASPMLDLAVLRSPQLTAAATATTVAFMAMIGGMFLIAQSLQLVKGYSPLAAALATSGPITTVNFLLMPRAPWLTERFGARWMIAAGCACVSVASMVLALTTVSSGYLNLLCGFAIMAIAFSVFVPASTEAIMTAVPKEKAGGASAINQTTRQLGAALGVAVGGSIAVSAYQGAFPASVAGVPAHAVESAGASITGALDAARGLGGAARDALLGAAHAAFQHGVTVALLTSAVLAAASALFAAVAIPARRGAGEPLDVRVPPEEMAELRPAG